MIIGITGSSGSGKTIVSNMLKEKLNCSLVDADSVAKELAQKGNSYYKEIVKYFGENILDKEKEINRKALANIIYEDSKKREKLNELTNIYVADKIAETAINLEKEGLVIIDVPRLFESGLNKICNIVISVLAEEKIKLERICKRDNIDINLAQKRLGIQQEDNFYIKNSGYVINNNNENIEETVEELASKIMKEIK
jgi:dephospho-CoA kinase